MSSSSPKQPARHRWHVFVQEQKEEMPGDNRMPGDQVFPLPFDIEAEGALQHNTWERMRELGLRPSEAAVDLYRASAAAFAADLRIPRRRAYDRWTRDIALSLPVADPVRWKVARPLFEQLLSFLTGDHWEVVIRQAVTSAPPESKLHLPAVEFSPYAVSLLSGGLDSFIGASDLLARGERLLAVSHYASGSASASSPAQDAVTEALVHQYPDKLLHLKVNVSARTKGFIEATEDTTRSRSIIFLALGTLAASALQPQARRLVVPENGFISLNPPLTLPRLGSLSTRTTHPHTLSLFRRVLAALKLGVEVVAPYQLKTKGEMLKEAVDQEFVKRFASDTVSCARPTIRRFHPEFSGRHCGYCVPCIIRRAAFTKLPPDRTPYLFDVRNTAAATHTQSKDMRAFLVAIQQARVRPRLASLLATGPLLSESTSVSDYADVVQRGLAEVQDFFGPRRRR